MGTSHSFQELAGKIEKAADYFPAANRAATKGAAEVVKTSVMAEEAAATKGSMLLRNVGKGARVGVSYKLDGTDPASALVKATGPVKLLEDKIADHLIAPKGVKVSKGRNSRRNRLKAVGAGTAAYGPQDVLKIGTGYARYAMWKSHSGGKHPWAKGVAAAVPLTPKKFETEYHSAMLRVFR